VLLTKCWATSQFDVSTSGYNKVCFIQIFIQVHMAIDANVHDSVSGDAAVTEAGCMAGTGCITWSM
jgi:hypothetical protein